MKLPIDHHTFSRLHMKLWGIIAIALLLVIMLIASLRSHGAKDTTPTPTAVALTVQVAASHTTDWPETIQISGPIAAWQEAIIGSQIAGQRLDELRANVGDKVKKGDVLARYNSATLQAEQAELQAVWQQAESDRVRATSLKGSGAMSRQQIENYTNQAAIAKARLDAKNLQLRYITVVAPTDGTISARTATLGAIGSTATELFRLIVDDRIEWRGELNAQQLTRIKTGQTVAIVLPDGSHAQASIRQVSPSLDTQSRMATVYADITPGSNARAGMYASGTIAMETRPALVIPAVSVVIRDGRSYVFSVETNTDTAQVIQQAVTTGRHQGNDVEITEGLTAGVRVVTQGAGFLNDGDSVRIVGNTLSVSNPL